MVLSESVGLHPQLNAVISDLNNSEQSLAQLTHLIDNKALNHNNLYATHGLCKSGMLDMLLILVISGAAAILLTIILWVNWHSLLSGTSTRISMNRRHPKIRRVILLAISMIGVVAIILGKFYICKLFDVVI